MDPPCHGLFSLLAFLVEETNVMPHALCACRERRNFASVVGLAGVFSFQKKGLELVAGLDVFQQETTIHILT